jgi:hypothetical protein
MNKLNKIIKISVFFSVIFIMACGASTAVLACGSGGGGGQDYTGCSGNAIYWFDSCDNKLELYKQCTANQTCVNAKCVDQSIACNTNSDCGTNSSSGSLFCQGNSVYQNYKTYTCNNPGTSTSYCSNSTAAQLQTACTSSQTCSNGSCVNTYVNTCTLNYQQRCTGNSMYWYDSCGNQGTYVGSCGQTYNNATLTVTKTVKDITTGTSFATSTYANPSDMLMFMITLQASGSDAQNVYIRDTLPANLIYNNQLVIACTGGNGNGNCNNNYNSGSIISGINLNTISSGQTETITYQAQVASAASFIYGTTTLNNLVSTTSSNVGYIPTASASVVVTKAGVLGASTVSTGLTNNFWIDSFFLPLLITLIVIWMWRSGMFFGIEKWLDNKKKVRRGYKAERELSARIDNIRKASR